MEVKIIKSTSYNHPTMNKLQILLFCSMLPVFGGTYAKAPQAAHDHAPVLNDRQIRTEINAVPERAAGIYYAYPYSTDSMAPAPSGYEPFYISHYGRHGSRWVINKKLHRLVADALRAEQSQGNLTDTGREVLDKVEKLG
ncbi:MAG: hypothetical protein K2O56_08785, partial [Muribaculaceae bacterium]|nr:hypothetical protein [Muribaculaceae bacterium]